MRLQKQNDQIKGGHVAEGKYICIRLYVFDDFHFLQTFSRRVHFNSNCRQKSFT